MSDGQPWRSNDGTSRRPQTSIKLFSQSCESCCPFQSGQSRHESCLARNRQHHLPHGPTGQGHADTSRPIFARNSICQRRDESFEPSPSWLRARHAAANTLIPNRMGPDGFEPSPGRLKVCCAAVTPRPRQGTWIGLCRVCRCMTVTFRIILMVLPNRWEWSRTTASAISERRASVTPPSVLHVASHSVASRDGRNRTDFLVFPRHAGDRCPASRKVVACSCRKSGPYGSRTHLPALKERYPPTDRRTSRGSAPRAPAGREALESSSPDFQPGARPSQLPTRMALISFP